jgi:flagellar basal body-associated protein FliL
MVGARNSCLRKRNKPRERGISMSKSKGIKGTIMIIVLMALVVGYYFYLSNREKEAEETEITAVQDVILRDLDTNYPPTPREVIKYYSDITKCLYNEKYSEDQLEQMADKLLALYDDELAENNPREQYIVSLKDEVETFKNNSYSIVNYSVSTSTDVEEFSQGGRQCASLYCTYSVKSGSEYTSSKQEFILRKDTATGHWKILGFELVNPE